MRAKLKLPKTITVPFLESIGACGHEIRGFKKLWPRGCKVTEKNLLRALDAGLTPYYIMEEFLWYYHFVTRKAWCRYYAGILRIDQKKQQEYVKAEEKYHGFTGPLYEATVLTARRNAEVKEAKLTMGLWRKAKKEVRVADKDLDRC